MNEPWTGAWRWVSDRFDGRPTVTSTRYCYLAVAKGRTPVISERLSDADAATLFRGVGVAGGGVIETPVDSDESLQTNTNFVGLYPKDATSSVLRAAQVDGDKMAQQVLGPGGEVLAEHHYVRISDAGSSDLAGAWELRASGWSGIVIFTDSEYQYLITRDDRPAGTSSDSPDSDLAELFRSTFAQAGAFRKGEGVIHATPEIAMDPAHQGREVAFPFRQENTALELDIGGQTWALEKVE